MISKHIIKDLKKELEDRDRRIELLEIKNHELKSIQNDWIEKEMNKEGKKFPEDYIKQKEEFAKTITYYRKEMQETNEIISMQNERHKKEVDGLKFEIELLREQIPKKSFFDIFKKKDGGKK